MKPPNESGGMVSQTAACVEAPTAKPKPTDGELLNLAAQWSRHSLALLKLAQRKPRGFEMLRLHLEGMAQRLAQEVLP